MTEYNSEAYWITWDVSQTFTPQQLIGVLALKPDGVEILKLPWTTKGKAFAENSGWLRIENY